MKSIFELYYQNLPRNFNDLEPHNQKSIFLEHFQFVLFWFWWGYFHKQSFLSSLQYIPNLSDLAKKIHKFSVAVNSKPLGLENIWLQRRFASCCVKSRTKFSLDRCVSCMYLCYCIKVCRVFKRGVEII